ncbi:MAG: PhnD/SsuA/transferrin family substrate-binding protein [Clostridiales bacterium]|nr:PhnD/SsuA/transferrin family substrate-binding protein [Clostridiales bacterium]
MLSGMIGCGSGSEGASAKKGESDTITMVWYPNESGGDYDDARQEMGKIIEEATGKTVEHKLTTDYSVAIESLANGTASICFMGAQGYVEAHTKNNKVLPLVVGSGKSGTLDDAKYYSWLAVTKENASQYQKDGKYVIDNIEGKRISFVSNSSTSGFKVPTSTIVAQFSKEDKWKDLKAEDLMEGGKDKFFSEVLFGGSHQGSAVNLLTGKADVAAFCDTTLVNYCEASEGEFNKLGTTYKIKDNAAEPFNTLVGKEFVAIANTPVLNAPFAMNTEVLSEEDQKKIIDKLTSDEVTNNKKIFVPAEDKDSIGLFKQEGKNRFVKVEDSWFDPIRELSK